MICGLLGAPPSRRQKASPCRILLTNWEIRRHMKALPNLFGSAGETPALPANRKIKSSTNFESASEDPLHLIRGPSQEF
jgi:hypothetical protein